MSEKLLKDAAVSGLFHLAPSQQSGIAAASRKARLRLLTADVSGHLSMEATLHQLGTALKFPTWYGGNLDALYDCLSDPDWQAAKGHVLVINGLAGLQSTLPADFATLIEVLQAVAEDRRARKAPFWILIDTPAPGIPPFPEA